MKKTIEKIKLGIDDMFVYRNDSNILFRIDPRNAGAIKGYEQPKNFPFCCGRHKKIFVLITQWFDEFPYCCDNHKKMADDYNIKKKDYNGLPYKIISCLSYTEYFIEQRYKNKDWYNDITNYIDYIIESFGQPVIGTGHYYNFLINYISHQNNPLSETQKIKLLKYLEPNTNKNSVDDAVILLKIYSKWLELFPFELSYFSKLKKYFSSNLPLINEKPIYNPYTNKSKAKFTSKENLLNVLAEHTKYLLTKVSGVKLRKAGILETKNQIVDKEIEILNESSELELKELNISKNDDSRRYSKIINKWFENQEKYFKNLYKLIEKQDEILKENKQETKKINNTKKTPNSYTYIKYATNSDAITDVLSALKRNNFIDDSVKLTNFRNIFNNKKPKSEIIWSGNISELYYFVKLIHIKHGLIEKQSHTIWKVTANIFVDKNKNQFFSKQLKSQKDPKSAPKLKKLVKNLL